MPQVVVVDTSGLIAAVDSGSFLSAEVSATLRELRGAGRRLVLSPFVLAEADYLISDRLGRPDIAFEVLQDVVRGAYHLEPFDARNVREALAIIERYADQNVGLADAANVVLAERHDTRDILTLDERHFRVLRGPADESFRLLPQDR